MVQLNLPPQETAQHLFVGRCTLWVRAALRTGFAAILATGVLHVIGVMRQQPNEFVRRASRDGHLQAKRVRRAQLILGVCFFE